jgi:hypothetical protein
MHAYNKCINLKIFINFSLFNKSDKSEKKFHFYSNSLKCQVPANKKPRKKKSFEVFYLKLKVYYYSTVTDFAKLRG